MMEHTGQSQLQPEQIHPHQRATTHDVRVIESPQQMAQLASEWRSLFQRDGKLELSMSFEWLSTWLDVYLQPSDRLFVVAVFCHNQLAFLAPFYLRPHNLNSSHHFTLQLLGNGEAEQDEVLSEFQDFLLDRALLQPGEALTILTEQLRQLPSWRHLQFYFCRQDSLVSRFAHQLPLATLCSKPAGIHFQTPLADNWRDTRNQFPSQNRRKHAQKVLNRLNSQAVEYQPATSPQQLQQQLTTLSKLHTRRWQQRAKPGAFASDTFCRFHQQFSQLALANGWLAMAQLTNQHSGDAIAVIYCVIIGRRRYYYQSGFDPDYSQLSPVSMLHLAQIQSAITDGEQYYDWMCGQPSSYKRGYARQQIKVYHYQLFRRGIRSLLPMLVERLRAWRHTSREQA